MVMRLLACALALTTGCVELASGGDDTDPGLDTETTTAEVSVTWTNLVGVSASGNDLTKTATTNAWNAGAVSVDALTADGYVELTVGETGTGKAAGLSNGDGGQSYGDIDFALRFTSSGVFQVFEGGLLRGTFGSYAAGDRFRIEVLGGIVRYSRSGGLPFYTSEVRPTFPLLVDTSFFTPGATLDEVDLVPTMLAWQNVVGVSVSDDDVTLTKTSSTTGWSAGASSATTLTGDGFVEFVATDTTTAKAAGLSNGDSTRSYVDIDYAIRLGATGGITVTEGGTLRGTFGKYRAGDRFRVEVSGGVVRYSTNGGAPFYESTVPPTFPLRIDTSFNTAGAVLTEFALVEGINACPAYAGTGFVCDGNFTIDSPEAFADVAFCARITGNLVIDRPGLAEISLPFLERVDGTLVVRADTALSRLRLPQLKEVFAGITHSSLIDLSNATRTVDLSRLRTIGMLQTYKTTTAPMSLPCLDTARALEVRRRVGTGSASVTGDAYIPRLRQVGFNDGGGSWISANALAPRLERVYGTILDGDLVAPVLRRVGGVGYYDRTATVVAPMLTDVDGSLLYSDADYLPALQRAGEVNLLHGAFVDLPALVEVRGDIRGGNTCLPNSTLSAAVIAFPALRRAGGIALCGNTIEQVSLPALEALTVPESSLYIESSAITEPVTLPVLALVRGGVAARTTPLELPVLTEIQGTLSLGGAVSAPVLGRIVGALQVTQTFQGTVSLPALLSTGDLQATSSAVGGFDLPALTQSASVVVYNCNTLTAFALPALQSIQEHLSVSYNSALTSLEMPALTSLGSNLVVENNPVLPTCYATNLRDQLVANGWNGTAVIRGNGSGTCP